MSKQLPQHPVEPCVISLDPLNYVPGSLVHLRVLAPGAVNLTEFVLSSSWCTGLHVPESAPIVKLLTCS